MMLKIHPTPTPSENYSLKHVFIAIQQIHETLKTRSIRISKKQKYSFNFNILVKGKTQVLLRFYLGSTYYYLLLLYYNILYYTILYYYTLNSSLGGDILEHSC